MEKRRRQGISTPQKNNNSTGDLVGNEELEDPVSDPNRTMKNITNELNDVHKKISQRGNHGRDH
jgi:hypothetical protein